MVNAGGFPELGRDGTHYNSAAQVDATGVRAVERPAHLWDREPECFRPGDARPLPKMSEPTPSGCGRLVHG